MTKNDPVDVGICRAGPYVGSWIMGPADSIIEDFLQDDIEQFYSWSWDFQPHEPEFDISKALTRKEALRNLREWQVDWVGHDLAALAREMLFDNTGFIERSSIFGLVRGSTLLPIRGVNLISYPLPLKLQSVRSVVTFKNQLENCFPQLAGAGGSQWSRAATDLYPGRFVEVSRRGWFAEEGAPGRGVHGLSSVSLQSVEPMDGDLVARAYDLAETDRCVAFVPLGLQGVNDPCPASPWTWVKTLKKSSSV